MAKLLPNSSMSYYEDEAIVIAAKMLCHSERSEESRFLFMELNRIEILRFAQNDKINYFFLRLRSLRH